MKIVFITLTSTIPFGSCDLLNFRVAKLAHQNGHQVLLSVNDFEEKHHKNYIEIERLGVKVHKRPMYKDKNIFTRYLYKIKYKLIKQSKYYKECFNFEPDYIFINNQGTYDFVRNPLSELLANTNIPFGILSQYNSEVNDLPSEYYELAKQLFLKANKLFFISNRNLETAKRSLALPLTNAAVVCNPLSSPSNNYISYPDDDVPTMCIVARFECNIKGQDIMLSVLADNEWKNKKWVLNLYGEGPDKDLIEDLIKFYGLSDKVFLKGYKNNIEDIWKENQLLIMPSISEGTPITLLTAIVAGRTCLVTNVGGNAEYVIDNETGFVAEAPTFNCLNEALTRAWLQRDNWKTLGTAARDFALRKIDFYPEQTILNNIINSQEST